LGEMVPFGPTLHTNVVAAASISFASRMPLLLVSSPVSILVPPNGQLEPAGSPLVRTKLFSPPHTYDVWPASISDGSRMPFALLSMPTSTFVPPSGQLG